MTPTERRDALIETLGSTVLGLYSEPGLMRDLATAEAADAIMSKVEEWLAEARETTWDECAARVGTPIPTRGTYAGPMKHIANPYRRSTP